jgi:hypothetical protein
MSDKLLQYEKLLKAHDWYYDYSDDHRAWRKGSDEFDALRKLRNELKEEFDVRVLDQIWNKYSPFSKETQS